MGLLKKKTDTVKDVSEEKEQKETVSNDQKKPTKSKKKPSGNSIDSWLVQPLLLVIVIFGIAIASVEFLFFQQVDKQLSSASMQTAVASSAQRINAELKAQEKTIGKAAEQLNALGSQEERQIGLQVLKNSIPELSGLYLVSSDDLLSINDTYPSLSFASVDLIRRVMKSGKVSTESFLHNKAWMYQIAVKTEASESAPANILIGIFNLESLKPLLKLPSSMPQGQVSLIKANGGKVIISNGQGETAKAVTAPTYISQWKVSFAPQTTNFSNIDRTLFLIINASLAVLLAILLFIIGRSKMNKIKNDLMLATQGLKAIINQEVKKPKGIHFAEVNSLVTNISQTAKDAYKRVAQTAAKVEPLKQAESAPQSDDPLFEDDLLDLDMLDDADSEKDPLEKDLNETSEDDMLQEIEQIDVPQSIFRAYDIRGIVDETLNENIVELIGKALATEAIAQGQSKLCVGYDGRLSSVPYCEAITRGIISTGVDAVIIGQVPTPVLYFATHHLETGSGVMITGSHNPGNYNGFKMMLAGNTLSGDDIQKLYNRITVQDFAEGQGTRTEESVDQAYQDYILNDIAIAAPLKVVVDAGNGVAGGIAPDLIEELGCEVIPLFCEVDGNFPNHHPDPGKPENLQDLIAAVKEHDADIGLAFDGDGDRVGVVTNEGKIIWPDRLLMLFAKDVVSRNPGADVIYDVKCSRRLNGLISNYGGRPIMWKTGHSLIKAKMKETGALLAGEMSGHIFFKERWFGFDDGLYSAVRLLEILGIEDRSSEEVFAAFPEDVSTPEINVTVTDESKFTIIEKLCMLKGNFTGGNVSTIDGLRVDYPNGWGLCRASNTTPVLVLRFEADDEASLNEIKENFKAQLAAVEPTLDLNF